MVTELLQKSSIVIQKQIFYKIYCQLYQKLEKGQSHGSYGVIVSEFLKKLSHVTTTSSIIKPKINTSAKNGVFLIV